MIAGELIDLKLHVVMNAVRILTNEGSADATSRVICRCRNVPHSAGPLPYASWVYLKKTEDPLSTWLMVSEPRASVHKFDDYAEIWDSRTARLQSLQKFISLNMNWSTLNQGPLNMSPNSRKSQNSKKRPGRALSPEPGQGSFAPVYLIFD